MVTNLQRTQVHNITECRQWDHYAANRNSMFFSPKAVLKQYAIEGIYVVLRLKAVLK
jgi:hypothetical protein